MRRLKKYIPQDDNFMPKEIDLNRSTGVYIRQSDKDAEEEHAFSRESQLKLVEYAKRLRREDTDQHIRVYDEGAGVSGQKRIDERKEFNRLYNDIKRGIIGSVVIIAEDRLFRDKYHTQDTTFIEHLARHDVLLFVRTEHRRYDCTRSGDREALLKKMVESRSYLDNHVIDRMNGNQREKALQGKYDGRGLAMGYVIDKHVKKQQQVLIIYEPWAKVIRWIFQRFKELDSLSKLCREIDAMPFLFPDPSTDDFLKYMFKIRMTRVPGGFKPTYFEAVKMILTNPTYIGHWLYDDAIARYDNHEAIVDKDLFMYAYSKLTGCDLEGNYLDGTPPRRLREESAQGVLKHILHSPDGVMYVVRPDKPEYVKRVNNTIYRELVFCIRTSLIDSIFLSRVKELARADPHIAQHIEASITELEEKHAELAVSLEDQLAQVRLQIKKKMAVLEDQILTLDVESKRKYNTDLLELREQEKGIMKAQERAAHTNLKADYDELADVLKDIPGTLDNCSMRKKKKLAKLIVASAILEEISVHWFRFTVTWIGPLANRPDVCLIWRQRGKQHNAWKDWEDEAIREKYPESDRLELLKALPDRTFNMISQRAMALGVKRIVNTLRTVPVSATFSDIEVIPDPEVSIKLIREACKAKQGAYGFWLYSAGTDEFAKEAVVLRDTNNKDKAR